MRLNNGKDILNVRATSTDSAGNGYYRASDGNYYYGNAQNGYLVETEQTARLKAQKAAQNSSTGTYSAGPSVAASGSDWCAGLLGMLGGWLIIKLFELLGPVVSFALKLLFGIIVVIEIFPSSISCYLTSCQQADSFLFEILIVPGFIAIFALIAYNIYRSIKRKKLITKKVFIIEAIALAGWYLLSYHGNTDYLVDCAWNAFLLAFSSKFICDWTDKGIRWVRTRMLKKQVQGR